MVIMPVVRPEPWKHAVDGTVNVTEALPELSVWVVRATWHTGWGSPKINEMVTFAFF